MNGADAGWIRDVLSFWFDELGREAWFRGGDHVDRAIRERFLALHEKLAAAPVDDALVSADRALAAVLVLDQFPRNLFRGTPRAFATDALAREVAECAIAAGLDQAVAPERRIFFYLPFEHSEARADQARCLDLVRALGDAEYVRYAQAHKDVIDRFGRFPHRNEMLGRQSTAEETAFLKEPGSKF
jgi:uncharacterized protein (DUF924 family)